MTIQPWDALRDNVTKHLIVTACKATMLLLYVSPNQVLDIDKVAEKIYFVLVGINGLAQLRSYAE